MDAEFIESNKQRAQESIDAQIISLESKVLQLKKRRNDLSPVSALPGELLSSIFRACIGEGHPTAQRRTLATITWISATWRDVALNDAFLWSAIHSTFGPKWMGTYVERSRNAPITLDWQDLTLTSAMRRQANVMLGSQAKRMTSIAVVCGPTTAVDLAGMLSSPVPLLNKLQISVVHGWPEPVLETGVLLTGRLPHIEAPLLQSVEFLNCAIPWNSSAYRTITSIDITFEDCTPPFTSRELYTGLKNLAPRLQELTLHFDISFDELNDTNLGPIPLPALEYLNLGKAEDEAHDSMGLLPFLRLPTSVILHLRCDWSDLRDVELMCSGLCSSVQALASANHREPCHRLQR
ncbi:hypothetical protein BKA70DRAFT_552281 [Coprinopsis sp. MPI-PUGE-AT-0042]|nr:hypothetical protein BKA70DRAFT_552281 [Coprinopsis sp. MPI-PUGE-AT-0042]